MRRNLRCVQNGIREFIGPARVNIKSLAAEARFIREEIKRRPEQSEQLWPHRCCRVRSEARLAQVAYAFARNVPYRKAEPKCTTPIKAADVKKKLRRWYWKAYTIDETEIEKWLNELKGTQHV